MPGKVSGEPHVEHSRLTTLAMAALASQGFTVADLAKLYPRENLAAPREAIGLERRLAA